MEYPLVRPVKHSSKEPYKVRENIDTIVV